MGARAHEAAATATEDWDGLIAQGTAYIEIALDPEVRRIVLLDGPLPRRPLALAEPERVWT